MRDGDVVSSPLDQIGSELISLFCACFEPICIDEKNFVLPPFSHHLKYPKRG